MLKITLIALIINLPFGIFEDPQLDPNIIKNLSKLVLSGNYSEIIPILDEFEAYYREVIKQSYNNDLKNFNPVLKFVQDCPPKYEKQGYEELVKMMKANNDLWSAEGIKLFNGIEKLDKNSPLINEFPDLVTKMFVGGGTCKLKNQHFHEYFYGADQFFKHDKWRRNVFTYVKKSADKKMNMDIRRVRDDIFTIRSIQYNNYLYADEDGYNWGEERRRVFMWRSKNGIPGNHREWKIEPQYRNSNAVKLRNVKFGEIMFVDLDLRWDKQRRYIFTERKPGFANQATASWWLEC